MGKKDTHGMGLGRVKRFFAKALPRDAGGHVLVNGNMHAQTSHIQFIREHLGELCSEHNLGTIGVENNPLYSVFNWAYRDGNLPVSTENAREYLKTMGTLRSPEKHKRAMAANSELLCDAMDRGIEIVNFDSRDGTYKDIKNLKNLPATVQTIRKVLADNPELETMLRVDVTAQKKLLEVIVGRAPDLQRRIDAGEFTREALQETLEIAYVFKEAEDLLLAHPQYMEHYENYQAVIEAGRKFGIGEDALSSAILGAGRDPSRNTFADIGLGHIAGYRDSTALSKMSPSLRDKVIEKECQGTFAQHLAEMPLPMTRAVITSEDELHKKVGWFLREAHKEGMPFADLPEFIIPDREEILNPESKKVLHWPGSLAREMTPLFEDLHEAASPSTMIEGTKYVGEMKAKLAHPEMVSLLSQLR